DRAEAGRIGPGSMKPKQDVPVETQKAPPPRGKRAAITALMLLLPFVCFGLVEGGLRQAGHGDDYPAFIPVDGFPGYRYQNRQVARRYFAREVNVPNSPNDFFLAEKTPEVFRVFVQGESSAAGFPYYYGGSFSRMLEQRLQQTFPD